MKNWSLGSLLLIAIAVTGCGSSDVGVTGTVNLNGKPLEKGEIIFEAADGKSAPTSGTITNGKYELQTSPGAKKVKINASKPAGEIDPVMKTAPLISIIPEEYNTKSKLTATVTKGEKNVIDFNLKSALGG